MTQNQEIANTILQQLGGGRFVAMTGARQLVAVENGLRFRIGRNGSKANIVRIVLRGDDTYDMQFIRMGHEPNLYDIMRRTNGREEFLAAVERARKNAEPKVLQEYNGVYCDQLEDLFRNYTKLYTRLY